MEHFKMHFAKQTLPTPPEIQHPEQFPHLMDEQYEIEEGPPTVSEVKTCHKTFKDNKSSGTDKVKTEALKYNTSHNLVSAIVLLLLQIWTCMSVPAQWLQASITCLYKKGKKKYPCKL